MILCCNCGTRKNNVALGCLNKRRTLSAAMKKSKLVPLLFIGAILLPGCGSSAPRNYSGSKPTPSTPAAPTAPAPFFVTCKNCKTINEVAEGGGLCRQCGKPLDMPPQTATTAPRTSTSSNSSGITQPRTSYSSGGPIILPGGGGSFSGSRPSGGSSSTGPRTYSSGSSTRTPISPSTPSRPSSSSGSSFSSSKPSSSSSGSTVRGGFGSSSRSSIS